MRFVGYIVFGSIMSLGTTLYVFAQENIRDPGNIIEDIYETAEFLPLINLDHAKVTLQDLAMSLQQMQVDYDQVDEKRTYLEEKYGEMTKSIERTLDIATRNKALVGDTLRKISLLEANITDLKEKLHVLKTDLSTARGQVASYIVFLYQSYQSLYGTTDTFSLWKQFLGGRVIDIGLTAQQFAEMLTNALEEQMNIIKQKQLYYADMTREMNNAKIAYHQTAQSLQRDLERLEEQKQYLYAQLRALQTDKATLDKQAADLRRTKEEVAAELMKVKKMTLESVGSTSQQVAALLKLPDRSVGRNYFTWPILPPKHIATFFGDVITNQLDTASKQADYMRFELPQGELVYASAPGLVHSVADGGMESASQVVMLHKQGLVTVYTPMEDIYVKPGEVVRRGQILGTSGGQPGTKGAGLESSIPHLDYFVFFNTEAKDPFEYLDLSVIDKEQVPEQRQGKRIDDGYARDVPVEPLPGIVGETVAERRDSFLKRYARGAYADAALWYDAAEGQGVDPLLGMCVGFAETGFKNFKTPNNIGNVGNNDRGDVVTYEAPIVGARALYSVLNNQYLGGYHTLNELSRFGNSDGFIYASSPYNRQRNVMRCLISIYGYAIPEDFPFRTPKRG